MITLNPNRSNHGRRPQSWGHMMSSHCQYATHDDRLKLLTVPERKAALLLMLAFWLAFHMGRQFSYAITPSLPHNRFDRRLNGNNPTEFSRNKLATISPSTIMGTTRLGVQFAWMTFDSSRSDAQSTQSASKSSALKSSVSAPSQIEQDSSLTRPKKRKYSRKLPLTPTEKAAYLSRSSRQAVYEEMRSSSLSITNEPPSIWRFDSLFAKPVFDEQSIREDLYGSRQREDELNKNRERRKELAPASSYLAPDVSITSSLVKSLLVSPPSADKDTVTLANPRTLTTSSSTTSFPPVPNTSTQTIQEMLPPQSIDKTLTRMVQDRINGLTRTPEGSIQYSTSLLDSSRAVQFREGVRLGKALTINIDRLTYFAKKELSHGRLEEAQECYMEAVGMDPSDGRPYLGLSRIAERRGDLEYARAILKQGISKGSVGFVQVRGPVEEKESWSTKKEKLKKRVALEGPIIGTIPDIGPNPFLLQALGTLEQKTGNLANAEGLYLQALRSRPSHAAAWVSLAQLRTKELRQSANAVRICYQSAEIELKRIGARPNAFIYTAWASMEYKKGREDDSRGIHRARELYQLALDADPYCSTAYLQLGAMESECGNFDRARDCFEKVLKFDQRNSRVLQAYAIMESRRPKEEVRSRRVLELFERALKVNQRDAGVYQAYALYVAELGDVDSARDLIRKGTAVDKRHAPVWQAWGVLETRYGTAKRARDVFQQGIWACAQPGGGQSGGRRCARLWQAWGVLEAQEGDHAAARRCFSRALDADPRNVAAVTAWTSMEADIENYVDARSIFERTLKLFRSSSDDKMALWRAWEIMEERAGNTRAAQLIFQRSMRDSMSSREEEPIPDGTSANVDMITAPDIVKMSRTKDKEVEVSRWVTESNELDADVWLNNGSIEGKIPAKMMKKLRRGESLGR